jgi:archaellum biogenesis ATPase FlaH
MASLNFTQTGDFKLPKVAMNTDKQLHNNLKEPLSSIQSGRLIVIAGAAGSGKTSALVNLFVLGKCKQSKKKLSLKGCFDNIFVVSPSMGSFKNDIFKDISDENKFDNLLDFLDSYKEIIDQDEEETCVVLDDIGSQIRTKEALNKFNKMIHNRRHQRLTIFAIVQNIGMVVPAIRDSVNILITFKPKSIRERELIYDLTSLPKKHMEDFFNGMFREKFDCVLVDMTLTNSNEYEFYRNIFNKINFQIA